MKLTDLKPAPYNPRKIGREALDGLQASLVEFGDISGIVLNERTGHLVAGHQRVEALKREYGDVPISNGVIEANGHRIPIRVVDWDEDKERLANVAANNPHVAGEYTDALEDIIRGLEQTDYGKLLEPLKLNDLLPPVVPDVVEDEVPEAPDEPITKPGDLWVLGDHRVLCGDSTKADDVGRLMDGGSAGLCFTSPPYGQQRDYGDASDVSDWDGLMRGVFAHLPMADDGQVLVNLGLIHRDGEWIPYWDGWIEWMRGQGWKRFGWYVWDKGYSGRDDGDRFATSHEFVWHWNKQSVPPERWVPTLNAGAQKGLPKRHSDRSGQHRGRDKVVTVNEFRKPGSVVRVSKGSVERLDHPAMFPVALAETFIRSWLGSVYDPFLGSGTTLIAAEQLGRKCYGIEIEPKYCDVIVKRWETLTGREAKRA